MRFQSRGDDSLVENNCNGDGVDGKNLRVFEGIIDGIRLLLESQGEGCAGGI